MPFLCLCRFIFPPSSRSLQRRGRAGRIRCRDDDGEDHIIHLEDLRAIDDQIAESAVGSEKFSDDYTNKTESDVDLHCADQQWDRARYHDLHHNVALTSAEGVDQFDFLRIGLEKASEQCDDGAEDGNGDGGDNNRADVVAEPYDQYRSKSRFRQAVKYDEARLQDLRQRVTFPQKDGGCGRLRR